MKAYLKIKRIMDILFSLAGLLIVSEIVLIIGIVIKVESKGPVFFKQSRVGKNGRTFVIYKFRTMRVETIKDGKLLSNMERVTKFGEFLRKNSIDELPQLFNILKGDMSFIGPRPLLVQYLKFYNTEQMKRHEIMPGISGWAQVNGRNAISWEEKFKFDVWYVDNCSFIVDFKILLLTILNVISKKDINNSKYDTMPFFTGNEENNFNV